MKLQFSFSGHPEKDNELQKTADEKLQALPKLVKKSINV